MNRYALSQGQLDARAAQRGVARPPTRTIAEAAGILGITSRACASLVTKHGLKPVVVHKQRKHFSLADFFDAFNKEKGERMFAIKKNVPIPPKGMQPNPAAFEIVQTARTAQVGDSFSLTVKVSTLSNTLNKLQKDGIGKFSYRSDPGAEGDREGCRPVTIWRMA